jgi:uncharacterized protein YifE (UPF0438 family)
MSKKRRTFTSLPVRIPNRGLTEKQIKLLNPKNLAAYIALDEGRLYPKSDKHLHFIAVCRDNFPPTTEIERTYLLWRSLILKEINYDHPARSRPTKVAYSSRAVTGKSTGKNWPEWIKNGGQPPASHSPVKTAVPDKNDPQDISSTSARFPAPRLTPTKANNLGSRTSVKNVDRSYLRFIDEPWGTREAWKRDRGSWRR